MTRFFPHLGRDLGIPVCLVMLMMSCGKAEEAVAPKSTEKVELNEHPKRPMNPLDEYGNLKSNERQIFGFALPESSYDRAEQSAVPVIYVPANERRLLRFYRSRGHTLIKTTTGWHITHSERTLRGQSDREQKERARIYARQGPGSGWTLLFDSGAPTEMKKPALISLIELETAKQPAHTGRPETPRGASEEAPPSPDRARVKQLERAALKRKINTRRAKDVSERIYEHVKRGDQKFLD